MKINRLIFLFIVVFGLGCSSENPKLVEANEIHLANTSLFLILESKLDSLQKIEMPVNQKNEFQMLRSEIMALEENMVEVPGFEHEHQHDGHNHRHETPINYTDYQTLAIQKEVNNELLKIRTKLDNFRLKSSAKANQKYLK
jgi:hypothetical protein